MTTANSPLATASPNKGQGYSYNPLIKKDGVQHPWTPEDIIEYQKCMDDPVYFAKTYIKIINLDRGLVPFDLYPYQEKMFDHFNSNRFSIVLACRQSGKSISSVAYILWYAVFHPDKTIAILANKGSTAREMLSRVTLALENLPFFLQPGAKAVNKGSLEFSHNTKIIAAATSGSSIRGLSVNLLFLDEFAFVERANEFYTSTYPVISAGTDTKVIITSTANGIGNTFHKIWEGALQQTNQYAAFTVNWWDVPGRDEKWKLETISNTSSLQFDQEFGNTFFGTGDTLINAEILLGLRAENPKSHHEGGDLLVYVETIPDHNYIMTVDVSKGRGQDYSTFTIIDISNKPFEQVAVYRCNTISPLLFPDIIYKYAKVYNDAYVVVESNDQGSMVLHGLWHDHEYESVHVEDPVKHKMGVEITRKSKRIGCSGIKDIIENSKLILRDEQTIMECSTFVAKGVSFEASEGNHDDLMMNLVMFGYFATSIVFEDLTDINLKEMMFSDRMRAIEDDVVPFGIFDDGSETINAIEQREEMKSHGWQIPNPDIMDW